MCNIITLLLGGDLLSKYALLYIFPVLFNLSSSKFWNQLQPPPNLHRSSSWKVKWRRSSQVPLAPIEAFKAKPVGLEHHWTTLLVTGLGLSCLETNKLSSVKNAGKFFWIAFPFWGMVVSGSLGLLFSKQLIDDPGLFHVKHRNIHGTSRAEKTPNDLWILPLNVVSQDMIRHYLRSL